MPILRNNIQNLSLEKKRNTEKISPNTNPNLIMGSFFLAFAAFLANKKADNIENRGSIALIIPIKDLDAPKDSAKFEMNKLPAIYERLIENPIKE
jgi:hypothetical protein